MRIAQRMADLPPYLFAEIDRKKALKIAEGVDVISLGIGDPDLPTPQRIIDAMAVAITDPANHQYPAYAGSRPYRAACAEWMSRRFGVTLDPDTEVLGLIGSKEGIAHLFPAFIDVDDYTLVPGVGYPVYSTGGVLIGGKTHYMPMNEGNDWLADFESTPDDVLARAKMMFISYPNNPAAVAAPVEYFDRAIAFAKEHDLLLVHDNAYSEIGFDGYLPPSIMERPGARDVAIEFFSCSKAYNMTGWRIAFACGNEEAIKTLGTVKSNVDSGQFTAIQQAAMEAMLGPQDDVAEMCAIYQRRRDMVLETLPSIGLSARRSAGTIYVWARIPDGYTSAEYAGLVLDRAGVIMPAGSAYGPDGEGYVRISLATPDDRLAEALQRMANAF
ncbi:MAG: LL-diaminopimelate aminotransferase [Coriobacteriia bacterium]|nr:LL-diaminopimelate aminotransferase [Coriobacteriia bacterium]MBN2840919.1 LL-diaminopimelate aminotransferase [Coriobacteriia bacterium]